MSFSTGLADLILMEMASLLAKRVRRKQMSASSAIAGFELFKETAPRLVPSHDLLDSALKLAVMFHVSTWDCFCLALALKSKCKLITADARLFRAAAPGFPGTSRSSATARNEALSFLLLLATTASPAEAPA